MASAIDVVRALDGANAGKKRVTAVEVTGRFGCAACGRYLPGDRLAGGLEVRPADPESGAFADVALVCKTCCTATPEAADETDKPKGKG